MKKYLLGIDQGTSALKAVLFDFSGSAVLSETADYNVEYGAAGIAEQNPEIWYSAAAQAIKKITSGIAAEEIAAIGVDGISWSPVFIDEKGKVLAKTPIWLDTRAHLECCEIDALVSAEKLFEICGNPLTANYGTPKALWFKNRRPRIFSKTYKILQSNSFLVYRLTGEASQDKCQSYAYHFYDMRTGKYNYEILKKLGLDSGLFPVPVDCDTVVGGITREAAAQTGLRAGTPVIAGGLDAACAALGAGVTASGQTQEQGGQAGGMGICIDNYVSNKNLILSAHVIPGKWLLQGGTTGGGGALKWFNAQFGNGQSFDVLTSGITEKPSKDGVIFLPYMRGERSPLWNPKAKGLFYGLSYETSQKDLVRAVLEGVAFSLRHNLETACQSGAKATGLLSTGGSANSKIWTQIKSDVTGLPISVPASKEATAKGAALLAGRAAGIYRSYEEAAERTVKETAKYFPDKANKKTYDSLYEKYLEIGGAMAPTWK